MNWLPSNMKTCSRASLCFVCLCVSYCGSVAASVDGMFALFVCSACWTLRRVVSSNWALGFRCVRSLLSYIYFFVYVTKNPSKNRRMYFATTESSPCFILVHWLTVWKNVAVYFSLNNAGRAPPRGVRRKNTSRSYVNPHPAARPVPYFSLPNLSTHYSVWFYVQHHCRLYFLGDCNGVNNQKDAQ